MARTGLSVIWGVLMPPLSRAHPQRVRVDNSLSASCAAARFMFSINIWAEPTSGRVRRPRSVLCLLLGRLIFTVCIFSGCAPFRKVLCDRHRSHMCTDPLFSRDGVIHWSLKAWLKAKQFTSQEGGHRAQRTDLSNCCLSLSPECLFFVIVCFHDLLGIYRGFGLSHSELLRFSSRSPLGSGQLASFFEVGSCPKMSSS